MTIPGDLYYGNICPCERDVNRVLWMDSCFIVAML